MELTHKKIQYKTTGRRKALQAKRVRRAGRIRVKVKGTAKKPRLSVMRSNKFIYVQLIDDQEGKTLAAAFGALQEAGNVGETLAKKAIDKKFKTVVFDKGAYTYHGRVKEVAQGARKGGLQF